MPDLSTPIAPAGRLGVATVGLGATTSTLLAGLSMIRRGRAEPIGSVSQLGTLEGLPITEAVPLARLDDLEFLAWDPYRTNAADAAANAGVLRPEDLDAVRDELAVVESRPAAFDRDWVSRLEGTDNVLAGTTKYDLALSIMDDLDGLKSRCDSVVMLWSASTEAYRPTGLAHTSLTEFEQGLKENDPTIAPSQIYAYAALRLGVPHINGSPNVSSEIPALLELADIESVPLVGKDYKTGQTLVKTILAPGLRARQLGVNGWFSTNILGNRDGEVLDDPENFRSKEITKLGVLDELLRPDLHPMLYGDLSHEVRINYYPPRGDDKEGWDNIDLFGWLGYPMQLKVNFLCRDSILAAPVMLDLILFTDLANRAGRTGIQDWLSFYVKDPLVAPGQRPEHDLFAQQDQLLGELKSLTD